MAFASSTTIPLEFELMLSVVDRKIDAKLMLRNQDPGEMRQSHHVSSHSSFPGWDENTRTRWESPRAQMATCAPIQFTHEPFTKLPDGSLDQLFWLIGLGHLFGSFVLVICFGHLFWSFVLVICFCHCFGHVWGILLVFLYIDLQHRIQPIIDVRAVYDAMQEIVRLNATEQLCENVTNAEKHTPDDQEQFYLRIHQDVLIPRSITMYSTFLPLPFHSLLQIVIGHVTSSHRSLSSPVLHLQLMTCLPLCGRRVFTDFVWPYLLWFLSTTSLKLTVNSSVAVFAVSSATFSTMFWSFPTPL